MRHKILTMLALLLCAAAGMAQTARGWYKYPVFSDAVDNLEQTPDKVYFRSGTSLFSYSPADNETYAYTTDNRLSDVEVQEIYYNPADAYLLVVYANSNLDLLYDDGRVVNLPDIKDANVYTTRAVRDVAFAPGRIGLSTDFGVVIYDQKRHEVEKSLVINEPVTGITIQDGNVFIAHDGAIKSAPLDSKTFSLASFTPRATTTYKVQKLFGGDASHIGAWSTNNSALATIDIKGGANWLIGNSGGCTQVKETPEGVYAVTNTDTSKALITISPSIALTSTPLPAALEGQAISWTPGQDKLWAGNALGVAEYKLSGEQLTDKQKPVDCVTVPKVGWMHLSRDGKRLYVSNLFNTNEAEYRPDFVTNDEFATVVQTTNLIDLASQTPKDVSIMQCSLPGIFVNWQNLFNNKRLYGGNYHIVENPNDPEAYFVDSNYEGWHYAKDAKQQVLFTNKNTTAPNTRAKDVIIDPEGNLWIGYFNNGTIYSILPAKFLQDDLSKVKKTDWIQAKATDFISHDQTSIFSSRSGVMFQFNSIWNSGLMCYDTRGTYTNTADDVVMWRTSFTDQDGKTFAPTHVLCAAEDKNGHIWVGTSAGPFVISDPGAATSANFSIRRPKVSRNDGTIYADYLLDGDPIIWISIDPANNKWIGTLNSGLYLVNEDGTRILAHYDDTNSPLSNRINTVQQDPNSTTVYVGAGNGLYRFNTSTGPAAEDYSEIYAYPNPVRPGYTGYVTITGLTEDSLVKITDASGQLVATVQATGGQALWDACNSAGSRVRSGVYYVFASSGPDQEKGEGAVTKIIVIN